MKNTARSPSSLQWQPAERLGQLSMDARLRPWLIGHGLLSERMRERCGARYSLSVVDCFSGELAGEHRSALRVDDEFGMIRDVEMRCGERAWVFKRIIVPDSTLEAHAWLAELGDAALSETLADLSCVERSSYEYAWLPHDEAVCVRALRDLDIRPAGLWARRSRILIRSAPLLSQELFLPAMGQA